MYIVHTIYASLLMPQIINELLGMQVNNPSERERGRKRWREGGAGNTLQAGNLICHAAGHLSVGI